MEDRLKEIELKMIDLKNLIDVAHGYVLQAEIENSDFGVFSSISEIIKNDIGGICADYAKMRDEYTFRYTLPNLNN